MRTLWLAPRTGELAAVLAELPIMLGASWLLAGRIVRARDLSTGEGAACGALAFVLLMAAEMGLALALSDRGAADWLAAQGRLPGLAGLLGQVAFAAMPALVAARAGRA